VFSFLPVLRRGLINLEGYIAFSLFPHLSAIPLKHTATAQSDFERFMASESSRFLRRFLEDSKMPPNEDN